MLKRLTREQLEASDGQGQVHPSQPIDWFG